MNPKWTKLVRFQHPEKMLSFVRHLDERLIGQLYGMDVEAYQATKNQLAEQGRKAAEELLSDSAFSDRVANLPFSAGETVIGVGESSTDDLISWLEILRFLLVLHRPHDRINVINEGISGNTSTQILGRFPNVVAQKPDWVIFMLGGNDVLRAGSTKTQVSLDETSKNVSALRHIATAVGAHCVWVTPNPFNEHLIAENPYFRQSQITWRNQDILAVGAEIRRQPDIVVDTQQKFGLPPLPELIESDGIHPTISGQKLIAKLVVEGLTGGVPE